jgi:hypothetical protein
MSEFPTSESSSLVGERLSVIVQSLSREHQMTDMCLRVREIGRHSFGTSTDTAASPDAILDIFGRMNSLCALCRMPAKLRRSHILPEFLYRALYDDKHRYSMVRAGTEPARYAQRGLTEPLLCATCEQRFGRYEKYADGVMTGQLGHRFRLVGSRITISEIDYTTFKLFQLSILWRASVSSLEFFKLVSLGPHEERIRCMLLGDEPGEPNSYGCLVVFASERGEDISDTFFNPEPLRWSGQRMVKFFFAGSAWLFHCDSRVPPAHLCGLFLQRDGTLTGLTADIAEARRYGADFKRILQRANLL